MTSDLADWIKSKLSSDNKVKGRSFDVLMLDLKDNFSGGLCLVSVKRADGSDKLSSFQLLRNSLCGVVAIGRVFGV